MLIAQLSDLHLCEAGPLAEKNVHAERAIDAVMRLDPRPDLVILTGDLVESGAPGEYALLQRLLEPLPMPVFAIPGNHDDREAMRATLNAQGYLPPTGPLNYVVETRPVRLVGVDSIIPGKVEGALAAETLDFVARTLAAAPDVPTLVFLHHPPFRCGLAEKDSIRLFEGTTEFEDILARNRQVERVVAGHHHRALQGRFGGALCQVAPPVRYMSPAEYGAASSHESEDEPAGFLLHRFIAGSGLATGLCPLPCDGVAAWHGGDRHPHGRPVLEEAWNRS